MTSEAPALKALLRAFYNGLLASDIDDIHTLYATNAVVLFPHAIQPAETEDDVRKLYNYHLTNNDGIFANGDNEASHKAKGKGKRSESEQFQSVALEGETTPAINIDVQEIVPLAPDWAFARMELTLPSTFAQTESSAATMVAKKIWAFLVFRKLGPGEQEEMKGWRIARSVFVLAGVENPPSGEIPVPPAAPEVRVDQARESPPLPRRQRGGKKGSGSVER